MLDSILGQQVPARSLAVCLVPLVINSVYVVASSIDQLCRCSLVSDGVVTVPKEAMFDHPPSGVVAWCISKAYVCLSVCLSAIR